MNPEIQTVGLGVYILSTLWLVTLLLCIISVRTGQLIGAIAFIVSSLITVILILIPRITYSNKTSPTSPERVYDPLFILRYSLLCFLAICMLGGLGAYFVFHCMSPVHTKRLRHWIQ